MDLAIFQDISTDKANNSVTIHHSEGAFTFVKDDLIKLDFPQQRKTTFFEESVFKILRYLTLFFLFGGFFNLFIYTKSHLAPDHWKYLTSSLFILILTLPLLQGIKEINRILKSPRTNNFIERNNQTNEMSKTIFLIIFTLGVIWTVFAYNSIWMLLSALIISLISVFILVLIILFGTVKGLKFIERLVHFYTDKEPKVMILTLKNQIVEYRITDRITNPNTLNFLKHYVSKPGNLKPKVVYSNMIALFVSMSVILISIFIFFKMDSPFWWRNLDFHPTWRLSYNWHNYFYADHNVLQVFAEGFASNLFVGTFILLALFLILVFLCSVLIIFIGLPSILTFNILKRILEKLKFEIHIGFLWLIYIVSIFSMIGGVTTLHAYFAKTDYSLTHKIGSIIILISPLIALLIQYLGLKLKNKLFTEIQVAWSSLFKPIN
jgi:hypothetical protein